MTDVTSTLREYLSDFGNKKKIDGQNLEQCLSEIKAVLEGSAKGRKASISPSQTNMTPRQLWFTLNGFENEYNPDQFKEFSKLKMLYSSVCEHVLSLLMKEAGLDFEAPKERLKVVITTPDGHEVEMVGSDDGSLDGNVIDIKMPNEEVFKTKFKSPKYLAENDMFGYLPQAYLYSKAKGQPFSGWIVSCASTGAVKFISAKGINLEESLDEFKENYDLAMKAKTYEEAPCKFDYIDDKGKIPWQCSRCRFRDACWGDQNLIRIENKSGSLRHEYVPSD